MAHSPELLAIAALVYAHAEKNYNAGGWDTIVECYSVSEIADELVEANITTEEAAIAHFTFSTDLWRDRDEEFGAIAEEEHRLAGWDASDPEEDEPRVCSGTCGEPTSSDHDTGYIRM